jgi:hypothetical protein
MCNDQEKRPRRAPLAQQTALRTAITVGNAEAPMSLAILQNEIEEAAHQASVDSPIKLNETEQTEHNSNVPDGPIANGTCD